MSELERLGPSRAVPQPAVRMGVGDGQEAPSLPYPIVLPRRTEGMAAESANNQAVIGYRYILMLETGEREHLVRHASYRRLREGETIRTANHGYWVVRRIVESDDPTARDGVAYCEPALASTS